MYSRPIDGSTGWIMMRNAPASEQVAIEIANAMRLILIGSAAISRSACWSCATAMMARPRKVRPRKSCSSASIASDITHGTTMRSGQLDGAERERLVDIGRADVAIIDPEQESERDFDDEQEPEEERQAAQPLLAASLERYVIHLVRERAERIEGRQRDDADEHRVEAELRIDDVGDVRPDDDEARMRDIDDVEDAERYRNAYRHGGIEAAEQQSRDQRVHQEIG